MRHAEKKTALRAAGDHQPTVRPARFRVSSSHAGFAAKVCGTPEVLEKLRVEMSHG